VAVIQVVALSPDGTALDLTTTVDWQREQQLLKLAFAWDVHATETVGEIQFGHVRRPLHVNTSWDAARHEIPAHRWVRVEEPGFGVTVANDRVHGRDAWRTTRPDGGTTTVVRESLLRAPLFPDPQADRGVHVFRHRLVPGDLAAGIAAGYALNCPPRPAVGAPVDPLVVVDGAGVLVEAVKLAEDGSGDVVVRLHEAWGRQARARVIAGFDAVAAVRTDLLERPTHDPLGVGPWDLRLRAFEIVTLRLRRAG
jgi:alpha-mannosidase